MNTGFLAPGGMGDGFFAPPAAATPDPSLDFSVDANSMYEFLMF